VLITHCCSAIERRKRIRILRPTEVLNDEAAARLEVRRDVAEARDVRRLRRQVLDRAEDEVSNRERLLGGRGREVADRHADLVAAGLARSGETIALDSSMPCTGTPRRVSGSAIRPVPIPNSSARPLPATSARKSTTASTTAGSNVSAADSSYLAATRSSK
jgi:hypothetical protein